MGLTKHPEGSLRELWSISIPLMLAEFSVMSLLFIDRALLSRYSINALNAAVNASTLGWAFMVMGIVLCGISKVFVAQYNGSGQKNKIGEPVWQMLYLALGSLFFFIPMAIWGTELAYGPHRFLERDYFRWMMYFGPSFAMYGALTGFFIGQGRTLLITGLAFATNFINIILDIVLIFGIEGWVPSLGVKGAAIATCGSSLFQVLVLFMIFLSPRNREVCGTTSLKFQPKIFQKCVKIGLPSALFVMSEILGFAAYYGIMTLAGEDYITVAGICQSIIILFYFFGEGIQQAVITIVGNFIGAGSQYLVPKVLLSGVRLNLIFFLIMFTIIFIGSDPLIHIFLSEASPEDFIRLYHPLTVTLYSCAFFLLFEGIRLLFGGILTAAGDTLFLMVGGFLSIWLCLVLPVYYVIVNNLASPVFGPYACVLYGLIACGIYYARFTSGKWREISLTASD